MYSFHNCTVHLDIIKFFYSPTDAQVKCLKNNFKICININIKTALTCFSSVTPSSGSALLVPAKVTVKCWWIKKKKTLIMYSYCYVYVCCVLYILFSSSQSAFFGYSVWLRVFRASSSVVRQMPRYNSQSRGTARTLPD